MTDPSKERNLSKKFKDFIEDHDLQNEFSILVFVFAALLIGTVVFLMIGFATGQFGIFRFPAMSLLGGGGAVFFFLILAGMITNRILSKIGLKN